MSAHGMGNRVALASASTPATASSRDVRGASTAAGSALLSAVMASNVHALVLADARGIVVASNPAFESITRLRGSAVAGRSLAGLLSPGRGAQASTIARAVLRGSVWQGDVSIQSGDGSALTLRVKVTPVLGAHDRLAHLLVEGIDESRKSASAELDPQVQTLGRLSSSIAHDFNNQLSVIINYTHIISSQLAQDSPLQDHLHDMQTTAWRATRLAHQLIVLGRRPIAEPQSLNLNEVIDNLAPLLRTLLGERVKLHTALDPSLWRVRMVLPQAEQVLVNLAVNARDAMLGAGEVELTTSNITLRSDDPTRPVDLAPGDYIRFSLSEQSAHNDAATVTPVDLTIPVGGLGPSMIHRAILQAGGSLALLANDDGGTTFVIHLPALCPDGEPGTLPNASAALS